MDRSTAEAFVAMAHRIVWATVATVDVRGRPRSRILHPIWELDESPSGDGVELVGWIATGPTPLKVAHLAAHPHVSVSYWAPTHDVCTAECAAVWCNDDETRTETWDRFLLAPEPVGYDPAIIPPWKDGPTSPAFGVLRLTPWFVRVFPGSILLGQGGEVQTWRA